MTNPHGPAAGTCFFGGPEGTGPVDGLQAEYARIPYAATTLVPIPDSVSDDQAILVSDIFPTAWFGSRFAEVSTGDSVLLLGAGVVSQLAKPGGYVRSHRERSRTAKSTRWSARRARSRHAVVSWKANRRSRFLAASA